MAWGTVEVRVLMRELAKKFIAKGLGNGNGQYPVRTLGPPPPAGFPCASS